VNPVACFLSSSATVVALPSEEALALASGAGAACTAACAEDEVAGASPAQTDAANTKELNNSNTLFIFLPFFFFAVRKHKQLAVCPAQSECFISPSTSRRACSI
jgi:hypothetical protein